MKEISTSCTLPPLIQQRYNHMLLSTPTFKFGDSSIKLLWAFESINKKCKREAKNGHFPLKIQKSSEKIKEWEELYERIKVKEKERESQKEHFTNGFFYSIGYLDRKREEIFTRLKLGKRYFSRHQPPKDFRNHRKAPKV